MAGEPYFLAGCSEDAETNLTLGGLQARVNQALTAGVPPETLVVTGYSQQFLRVCLYVVMPSDIKKFSIGDLRRQAYSGVDRDADAAWAEIERRILRGS